jgi:hypothetical protein
VRVEARERAKVAGESWERRREAWEESTEGGLEA